MSDLISRQDVIKAVLVSNFSACTVYGRSEEGMATANELIQAIKNLPSAEPEIIRCKDCKNSEHWYRDRRRCFLWSEDGVSVFDDGFCNYAERK